MLFESAQVTHYLLKPKNTVPGSISKLVLSVCNNCVSDDSSQETVLVAMNGKSTSEPGITDLIFSCILILQFDALIRNLSRTSFKNYYSTEYDIVCLLH